MASKIPTMHSFTHLTLKRGRVDEGMGYEPHADTIGIILDHGEGTEHSATGHRRQEPITAVARVDQSADAIDVFVFEPNDEPLWSPGAEDLGLVSKTKLNEEASGAGGSLLELPEAYTPQWTMGADHGTEHDFSAGV